MNRKLIRPNLTEIKEKIKIAEAAASKPPEPPPYYPPRAPQPAQPSRPPQPARGPHSSHYQSSSQPQKKMYPPTDTAAENYYYLKQMSKKTPMAVIFADGEMIEGYIEWYDRNCIKLNRDGAPNLLVFKSRIKYMYKLDEGKEGSDGDPDDRR